MPEPGASGVSQWLVHVQASATTCGSGWGHPSRFRGQLCPVPRGWGETISPTSLPKPVPEGSARTPPSLPTGPASQRRRRGGESTSVWISGTDIQSRADDAYGP